MEIRIKNGVSYLVSSLFEKHGIPHAFTTRRGGVSKGDFDSLNVSTRRPDRSGALDKYENTVENFSRALSLVGATAEYSAGAHQVHGNRILILDKSHAGMGILRGRCSEEADGLFLPATEKSLRALCVKSADCTPVLLADVRSGSVCAVHSGWRGTCLDIVGEAVRTMVENGSRTEDILCAVGPAIGACCYEVSEDVYLEAEKTLKSKSAEKHLDEIFKNRKETEKGIKYHFDIARMCAILARLAGIPEENIDLLDVCTCCTEDEKGPLFFSHRASGGHSGTFASVIGKREV